MKTSQQQAAIKALARKIKEMKAAGDRVPKGLISQAAVRYGVNREEIYRELNRMKVDTSRTRFELSVDHLVRIAANACNRELTYEELCDDGELTVSYATFARAYAALPEARKLHLQLGPDHAKAALQYLQYEAPCRNDTWYVDHWFPPVEVYARGTTTRLVRPVVTAFMDDFSRLVVHYAVAYVDTPSAPPTADHVAATMLAAMIPWEPSEAYRVPGQRGGGVPTRVLCDNGKELLAEQVALLCETVGSVYVAVAERSPEHKGKIERYFDTAERRGKLGLLPGSTAGTKSHHGRDPHRAHPLSAEQFEELLRREIHQHNFERVHSALGVTPWQRWCGESIPLIEPDVDETAVFVPIYDDPTRTHPEKRGMRKVEKRGVHIDNTYYIAPEIDWLVGKKQKVRVHALQGRRDFVDVWVEDPGVEPRFVGRCVPHHRLTDDQRRNILCGRVDTYLTTQAVVDAAADRNVETYTDVFAEADAAVAAVDADANGPIVLDDGAEGVPPMSDEAPSDTCDPSADHDEPEDVDPEPASPSSGASLRDLSVASDPYLSTNDPDDPSEEHS